MVKQGEYHIPKLWIFISGLWTWNICHTYDYVMLYFGVAALPAPGSSLHYNDIMISAMASQITAVWVVYSAVCSGTDHRKHQSSASLTFVRGIYRWPVNSQHDRTSNAENVSIWWRLHVWYICPYVSVMHHWYWRYHSAAQFHRKIRKQHGSNMFLLGKTRHGAVRSVCIFSGWTADHIFRMLFTTSL